MKNSQVVSLEEFNLFSLLPIQKSIEKDLPGDVRPTATIGFNNPLKFEFRTGHDEYIKMSETELVLKVRINMHALTQAGAAAKPTAAHWANVSIINNFMHSLFESVIISVNGKPITRNEQNYGYRAYLETLFGFNKISKTTHLSSVIWSQEEKNEDEISKNLNDLITPESNFMYKEIEMRGKLFTDLTYQPRALIGGINMAIELIWQKPNFFFHTTNSNINLSLDVLDAYLNIHRAKVTPSMVSEHNKMLTRSPAIYPIVHSEVRLFTINKDIMDAYWDNAITGELPRRIIVGLVSNKAANGDIKLNPYRFQTYDLSFFSAYINGVQYPVKPFTPDFENQNTLREYMALVEALNQDVPNSSFPIDREQFTQGFTLYAINFAPDLSDGGGGFGHLSEKVSGCLRLELKFKKQLKETVSLMLYSEHDNTIYIDKDRNAHTDFHI